MERQRHRRVLHLVRVPLRRGGRRHERRQVARPDRYCPQRVVDTHVERSSRELNSIL